jgi:hypothetical protein
LTGFRALMSSQTARSEPTPRGSLINDENWTLCAQSLRSHPTLETLDPIGHIPRLGGISNGVKKKYRCTCRLLLAKTWSSVHLVTEHGKISRAECPSHTCTSFRAEYFAIISRDKKGVMVSCTFFMHHFSPVPASKPIQQPPEQTRHSADCCVQTWQQV